MFTYSSVDLQSSAYPETNTSSAKASSVIPAFSSSITLIIRGTAPSCTIVLWFGCKMRLVSAVAASFSWSVYPLKRCTKPADFWWLQYLPCSHSQLSKLAIVSAAFWLVHWFPFTRTSIIFWSAVFIIKTRCYCVNGKVYRCHYSIFLHCWLFRPQ